MDGQKPERNRFRNWHFYDRLCSRPGGLRKAYIYLRFSRERGKNPPTPEAEGEKQRDGEKV